MPSFVYGLLAIAVVVLILFARGVQPGKNQKGEQFNNQADRAKNAHSFKVATFNVQTGKNLQGDRDINRAAMTLKDVDLAGVQEVYAAGWLNKLGFGMPQTQALAASANFAHLFAATRFRWFREQRGNAALSQLPIRGWEVRMLPDKSRKSPRNMTIAQFEWQGEIAVFINTHLHTGRGRTEQLDAVLDEFLRHDKAILVGDFNSTLSEPALRAAIEDPSVTDAIKQAGLREEGDQRIDWILTRGFVVASGRELAKGVSDHPYYEVELR